MKIGWNALHRRGLPFFLATPRSAIERLRSASCRALWHRGWNWRWAGMIGATTISWPIVALLDSLRIVARVPAAHRPKIFLTLYANALLRNVPPNQLFRYAPELGEGHRGLADFLLPTDQRNLNLLSSLRGADPDHVQNKIRFESICLAHRLPHAASIGWFDQGASFGEERLKSYTRPIFVKALTGNKGVGAERWSYRDGRFVTEDSDGMDIETLIARWRSQSIIVQPMLNDCEALREWGSTALSSLRIVTVKGPTTRASVIAASLSLTTQPHALVSHEGMWCEINIANGTIAKVSTAPRNLDQADADHPLHARAIPFWAEAVGLARRAHDEAFTNFVALGWDVALTSGGPLLLETNSGWTFAPHQLLAGPLGRTDLSAVIEELLAAGTLDRPIPDR